MIDKCNKCKYLVGGAKLIHTQKIKKTRTNKYQIRKVEYSQRGAYQENFVKFDHRYFATIRLGWVLLTYAKI